MKNPTCDFCINDCDQYVNNQRCDNFKKARPVAEYNRIIQEENRNIRRFCKENNLDYKLLNKMLKYKMRMKFKYRYLLEKFIFESDYWVQWEMNGSKTYEEK